MGIRGKRRAAPGWRGACPLIREGALPTRPEPLTAVQVRNKPPGRYCDGDGLYLLVKKPDSAFWVFRYTVAGRMREAGLGRARGRNAVSLAEARGRAAEMRGEVRHGRDPLAEREREARQQALRARTFAEAAEAFMAAREPGWRNSKHAAQWRSTLKTYAWPHLGSMPVADVTTEHVLAVLSPIWTAKAETAARVRGRIEQVLDAEAAMGNRSRDNPARWRGHLDKILPSRSKVAPVQHHAALPWAELPAFMLRLSVADGMGARALEFAILTAARTGEVLGARWVEIDLAARVWTVPAARMKGGREHRVPLCEPALALLRRMGTVREDDAPEAVVFPGGASGRPLSNMAMTMALRRMKRADLTAHGFRSTFRDWAAERSGFSGEAAEAALAHAVRDKTEAAYRRGDLFEKRRALMEAWGAFATRPASATVVRLPRATA